MEADSLQPPPHGAAPLGHLDRRPGPIVALRPQPPPKTGPSACVAPRSMRPLRPQATPALRQRPPLRLLLLLSLLRWPVPRAQATPAPPSSPSLRERARALMRDFPLVDGCVGAGWGGGHEPGPGQGSPRAGEAVLRSSVIHSPSIRGCLFPSSVTLPLVGTPSVGLKGFWYSLCDCGVGDIPLHQL